MRKVIEAATLEVANCIEECSCQQVHILFLDDGGAPVATATCDPMVARNVARAIDRSADLAEARATRQAGALI